MLRAQAIDEKNSIPIHERFKIKKWTQLFCVLCFKYLKFRNQYCLSYSDTRKFLCYWNISVFLLLIADLECKKLKNSNSGVRKVGPLFCIFGVARL